MLDQDITLKTTGSASTFVPNTKFVGSRADIRFADGMKGDEMLD